MAELPKVLKSVIDGCHDFAANSQKAEAKTALRQLFCLLYSAMKINPEEYRVTASVIPECPPIKTFEGRLYRESIIGNDKNKGKTGFFNGLKTAVVKFILLGFLVFTPCPASLYADDFVWTTKTSMPTTRGRFAAGVVNNKIYAIGGTPNGVDGSVNLKTVEEYDPATNTWSTKANMPTQRHGHAIGVVNNKIYVIAGWSESVNTWLRTVEEYDPATNIWTTKANIPTARRWLAAGVVNNKIYAIGGSNNSDLSTVEEYDPATNTWTTKASMPTARKVLAVGVVNNKIYAIGGHHSNNLTTVEEYDPATNTWTTKASMPRGRGDLAIGVLNNKIYAVGGNDDYSYYLTTVEEYDPATNTWSTKANMSTARSGLVVGIVNNRIYAIGGYSVNDNSLNTVEESIFTVKDIIPPVSSISSPDKPSYSYQWIPVNGTASEDTEKVEVQIYQHESVTYWDGQCWVGTPQWLLCDGTTSWVYPISTYFSENLKYTVKSRATDTSGNIETPSDGITFVIDKSPPTSYISFPVNGKTYSDVPKIYGQAQDWGSGVAFVRVRLKDLTDSTYWNGKSWDTNEVWVKAEGVSAFSLTIPVWKINHQYNVTSQAVDFGQLKQGLYSGWNFSIVSALKLSAKTSKLKYGYGEPIDIEINLENTSQSTQILEFPSSKIYDFTIDSIYKYSDTKTFTPSKTFISFQPGKTTYSEKINKILPVGQHVLTTEVETLKLTLKSIFEVVSDTVAPSIAIQPVADGQFKYFSVPVIANITDNSSISSVILHSGTNSWQMTKTTDNLWTGAIPAEYNTSSSLSYYIEAIDLSDNRTATDIKTITTKDVPAPEVEEIFITPAQEDYSYLLGVTNFAALEGVFYRVYYDRGTGKIDYSSWLGIIDTQNKTVPTPKLKPAMDYRFAVVPITKEIEESAVDIANIPAPIISIRTPVEEEPVLSGGGGGGILTIIKIPMEIMVLDPDISVSQKEIVSEKPVGSFLVSEPRTIISKKYIHSTVIPQPISVTINYIDNDNDGYLDGTNIKETTLIILRYDEIEKKWVGGFETIIYTEKNYCEAFVDRTGTYAVFSALQIYPEEVKNLKGFPTKKCEAKIEWESSLSASSGQYNIYYQNELYYEKTYSARYRIYWDRGTGTINYSKPVAEVKSPETSWVSQPLEEGLYKFAVRVVDIEGTEEKNINYVVVNIGKTGEASANIRIPKDGKRLRGNAVTIIANATPNTTSVLFQYVASSFNWTNATSDDWTNISIIDKKPPYAVYWNLSDLNNGEYKLRAVAYDLLNLPDNNPAEITVYVDDVNWDISENGNPDVDPNKPHSKQEKITGTGDTEILVADGTGAIVPEGVAEKGTVLNITEIESLPVPSNDSSIVPIGVFREYTFSSGKTAFEKEITIFLPYPDENNDGVVDGTAIKSETLEIYYLDEKKNEWKKADNRSGLGDGTNPGQGDGRDNADNNGTDNPNKKNAGVRRGGFAQSVNHKTISARVNHFTKFGIFAKAPKANLDSVNIYPNPFKPSKGHTHITFDGLTNSVKIKIYTIAGRLVDEFETATDGSYNWRPDVASGVYIYYVEDQNGRGKAKGKIGIIR